jgi:hypothetical protein
MSWFKTLVVEARHVKESSLPDKINKLSRCVSCPEHCPQEASPLLTARYKTCQSRSVSRSSPRGQENHSPKPTRRNTRSVKQPKPPRICRATNRLQKARTGNGELTSLLTCLRCEKRIAPTAPADQDAVKGLVRDVAKIIAPVVTLDERRDQNNDSPEGMSAQARPYPDTKRGVLYL